MNLACYCRYRVANKLSFIASCSSHQLLYIQGQSKRKSKEAYPAVLERFLHLGFNAAHLRIVLRYIRSDAPIIIHFPLDIILRLLIKVRRRRSEREKRGRGQSMASVSLCLLVDVVVMVVMASAGHPLPQSV